MIFKGKDNFKLYRQMIKRGLKPVSKDNHIGIELEVITKVPRDVIRWEFKKADILADVTDDGSIQHTRDMPYRAEIRALCRQDDIKKTIESVIAILKELGTEVNKSCGLHIHLDMRNRNVKECYKKLVDNQSMLRTMVDKHRHRKLCCLKNKSNNFKLDTYGKWELQLDAYTNTYRKMLTYRPIDRYHAINPRSYQEHKTLECRLHEATLDVDKIINWVNTLTNICDKKDVA